eukprot:364808-Chlamydomonas_euryale.AAC.12
MPASEDYGYMQSGGTSIPGHVPVLCCCWFRGPFGQGIGTGVTHVVSRAGMNDGIALACAPPNEHHLFRVLATLICA